MAEQSDQPKKARAALATERPVESVPATTPPQWVVTLDPADGRVERLERLDPASGQRTELPRAENESLFSYLDLCAAYWRGAVDFAAAVSAGNLASLQAYHQYLAQYSNLGAPGS